MSDNPSDVPLIPDRVAVLLGRLAYHAAWLDDTLGDAVVVGNPSATHLAESTPSWARSGAQLIEAVRAIAIDHAFIDQLATRLEGLNAVRNQLIHGIWLWRDDSALVLKRSTGKGERSVDYATYTYADIDNLVEQYLRLQEIAERFVALLRRANPGHESQWADCPDDGFAMRGAFVDGLIVWQCPRCGRTLSAVPVDAE